MPEVDPRQLAADYFRQAYESQMKGDYDQALELYTRSIEAYPTAEAYTFRGWTYSFLDKLDEAIEQCRQAIQVDPDFGNPYNDIGAYLIEKSEWKEAIPWLEKARWRPAMKPAAIPGSTWAAFMSTCATGGEPGNATARPLN